MGLLGWFTHIIVFSKDSNTLSPLATKEEREQKEYYKNNYSYESGTSKTFETYGQYGHIKD
jgi:hypothetical protein